MARFSTGNGDDALDLVQDAMLSFVKSYGDRPDEERRPLFYRILQNRIRDWHRRQSICNRFTAWLPGFNDEEDATPNPIDQVADPSADTPEIQWQREVSSEIILQAVGRLPLRQQQAFFLRAWEEMSVKDTACAMSCSEGSVKTHYSRALASLRELLKDFQNE